MTTPCTTTSIRNFVTELFGNHFNPDNRKTGIGRRLIFRDIQADLYERELLERVLVNHDIFANIKNQDAYLQIETMTI